MCEHCSCGHHEHEEHEEGGAVKIVCLALSFAGLLAALLGRFDVLIKFAVCFAAWLLCAVPVIKTAVKNMLKGRFLDENVLMLIASIGAFALGEHEEAVAVMLFYSVGEWLEDIAVERSRRSISALLDLQPEKVWQVVDGELISRLPEQAEEGWLIAVQPGERVPLDGCITRGSTQLNMAAITGESLPVGKCEGDEVLAGSVNLSGLIYMRVTRPLEDSAVHRVLKMVEEAQERKAVPEKFITRFAEIYTPAVVLLAAAVAVLPAVLFGQNFGTWLGRALVLLVASCPCALVLSIPLGYFAGIGGAARQGILIKGGNYLDVLAKVDTLVMDKTGTLTTGEFTVNRVESVGETDVLTMCAAAERHSSHVIAAALRRAAAGSDAHLAVEEYEEIAGFGVRAKVQQKQVLCGSLALMQESGIAVPQQHATAQLHLAVEGEYAGSIWLQSAVRPEAQDMMSGLKQLGIQKPIMLTGDGQQVAQETAQALGITVWSAGMLPQDKLEYIERMIAQKQGVVAFVGDGVNDAPCITRADIGIAMGAVGSQAAMEAADVVLGSDRLDNIPKAIALARRTRSIIMQNIVFALAVKVVVLALGAAGMLGMWAAVFADVGVALIAILNSMRAYGRREK